MDELYFGDSSEDPFSSNQSDFGTSAVDRARVLLQHVRGSDTCSASDNDLLCKSVNDSQSVDSSWDTASSDKPTSESSRRKNQTNWLDVLKINPKLYWPKKYRYTIEPRPGTSFILSIKEREFYEENGFLLVKNLIPKNLLAKLQKSSRSTSVIQLNQAASDEALREFISLPQLTKYLECYCGHNIMAMSCQKVSDTVFSQSNGFQRDLPCLTFRPADRIVGLVACLNSFDDTPETGLTVLPSSHRTGLLESECSDENGQRQIVVYERLNDVEILANNLAGKRQHLRLNQGDVVFYHPMLVYSLRLRPSNKESIIHASFASSECHYTVTQSRKDFRAQIPPILQSLVSFEQDQFVVKQDNWKDKGMLVTGKRINL